MVYPQNHTVCPLNPKYALAYLALWVITQSKDLVRFVRVVNSILESSNAEYGLNFIHTLWFKLQKYFFEKVNHYILQKINKGLKTL